MRHAHPVKYNDEMKNEASKGRNKVWLPREISEMAEAEARYVGKNLNSFLRDLTGRTLDSVKNRRKRQDYKDLVKLCKTRLSQQRDVNQQSLNSTLDNSDTRIVETITEINGNVDKVLDHITSILNDINDPVFKELTNLIISGIDVENNLNSMLDILCKTNRTVSKNDYVLTYHPTLMILKTNIGKYFLNQL